MDAVFGFGLDNYEMLYDDEARKIWKHLMECDDHFCENGMISKNNGIDCFSKETVIQCLETVAENKWVDDGNDELELMIYYDPIANEVWALNELKMALYLKRYDLVEKLLAGGWPVGEADYLLVQRQNPGMGFNAMNELVDICSLIGMDKDIPEELILKLVRDNPLDGFLLTDRLTSKYLRSHSAKWLGSLLKISGDEAYLKQLMNTSICVEMQRGAEYQIKSILQLQIEIVKYLLDIGDESKLTAYLKRLRIYFDDTGSDRGTDMGFGGEILRLLIKQRKTIYKLLQKKKKHRAVFIQVMMMDIASISSVHYIYEVMSERIKDSLDRQNLCYQMEGWSNALSEYSEFYEKSVAMENENLQINTGLDIVNNCLDYENRYLNFLKPATGLYMLSNQKGPDLSLKPTRRNVHILSNLAKSLDQIRFVEGMCNGTWEEWTFVSVPSYKLVEIFISVLSSLEIQPYTLGTSVTVDKEYLGLLRCMVSLSSEEIIEKGIKVGLLTDEALEKMIEIAFEMDKTEIIPHMIAYRGYAQK